MYIEYPNQRVSLKEKQKRDWYVNMYNYLIALAVENRDIEKIKSRILSANGVVSDSEFQYLIKPVNTSGVKFEMPGKIRDIDFINPIREKAIGSYSQLPYNFQVKVANPDVVMKRDVQLREAMEDKMYMKFAEKLQAMQQGQQVQVNPTQEQEEFNKFRKEFLENWLDERAIQGQNTINYLNDMNDYDINRIKAYSYWWMTEEVYTKRSIINGKLEKEIIPPYEIYPIDNGEEFVEDYDGVVRIYKMTYVDFMNKLASILTNEQHALLIHNIEKHTEGYYTIPASKFRMIFDIDIHTDSEEVQLSNEVGDFILHHIEFKSESEYKIRHYVNALGQERQMYVDNDYTINPLVGDIKVTSEYLSEVYEGYKIGDNWDAIYTPPVPIAVQRRDEINLRKVKLSYGGKKGIMADILINPVPTRLVPYLVYYKIINLHIERTLAKYQSAIKFMPKELFNDDDDMKRKDKIWYMKADNTVLYDHSEITPNEISQGVIIKGDPDIANYIKTLIELRISLKQEAYELANMNDEMVGQGDPRGNVTNNNNNIAMARLGSILSNKVFNKTMAKDLLADLDFSKAVFTEPTSLSYKDADGNVNYFDINPDNHVSSTYGISITDSDTEERLLREYKEFSFNASQNGDLDIGFETIGRENVAGIKKTIRTLIASKKEFDQRMAEREAAAKEEATAMAKESQDKLIASNEKVATMNNNAKIEEALIKSDIELMKIQSTALNNDKDEDGKDDTIEIAIKEATLRLNERAQNLAEQQFANKIGMDNHKKTMDKENIKIKKSKPSSK